MKKLICIALLVASSAYADHAPPQVEISGTGIGTVNYGNQEAGTYKGGVDFSDSAILFGASKKLYGEGIGSMGFGFQTPTQIHQAFLDYQDERTEWLVGRTNNPAGQLVQFPTLREEDLLLFTNPTGNERFTNSASFTLNQNLKTFESFHAQHLSSASSPAGINSFGGTFEYKNTPGVEALSLVPSFGFGYERQQTGSTKGIDEAFAGGVINLNQSTTDRVDFRIHDFMNFGPGSYNSSAAALRYLRSPYGNTGFQLALTSAYKKALKTSDDSMAYAVTCVRTLGEGFDIVVQFKRQAPENVAEAGFVFNFDAKFNEHLSPRRTILNTNHQYIPD